MQANVQASETSARPPSGPVRSRTQAVYERLRSDIVAGYLLPGTRLKIDALCEALGIGWTRRMLRWEAGPKPYDGVWAPVWYHAVWDSTGFDGAEGPLPDLPPAYARLAEASLPHYEALAPYAL